MKWLVVTELIIPTEGFMRCSEGFMMLILDDLNWLAVTGTCFSVFQILRMSSSQPTDSCFSDGVGSTTNQPTELGYPGSKGSGDCLSCLMVGFQGPLYMVLGLPLDPTELLDV